MTLPEVLQELVELVGSEGDTVLAWDQVRHWPNGAVETLQKAGWIEPTAAALTVECPGCERNCFMPVHVILARNGQPARAYVACDRRDDMGQVKIAMSRLQQWQITEGQIAQWASRALGLNGKPERDKVSGVFRLGSLQGKQRVGSLEFATAGLVCLKTSGHSLPLGDVVNFQRGRPSIDRAAILALVDLPPASESSGRARKRGNKPTESRIQQTGSEMGSPEWRKQTARTAANARHNQPGGSRDKQRQIRETWATGKYSSRDRCAEEECAALGMSYAAARKALVNIPKP